MKKNIVIAGATGMIGNELLQICLKSDEVESIRAISRKPLPLNHPKLTTLIAEDQSNPDVLEESLHNVDILFYCVGVYTGALGREAFRKITVDFPVSIAKVLKSASPQAKFILLSGAGADRTEKSRVMFAKDKGVAENLLQSIFGKKFHAVRPGYIYPVAKRKEPNWGYQISRWMYPFIKMMGKNYSITSQQLAAAMFEIGMKENDQEVYENKDLMNLLKK